MKHFVFLFVLVLSGWVQADVKCWDRTTHAQHYFQADQVCFRDMQQRIVDDKVELFLFNDEIWGWYPTLSRELAGGLAYYKYAGDYSTLGVPGHCGEYLRSRFELTLALSHHGVIVPEKSTIKISHTYSEDLCRQPFKAGVTHYSIKTF